MTDLTDAPADFRFADEPEVVVDHRGVCIRTADGTLVLCPSEALSVASKLAAAVRITL